jgi:hypothetical protein
MGRARSPEAGPVPRTWGAAAPGHARSARRGAGRDGPRRQRPAGEVFRPRAARPRRIRTLARGSATPGDVRGATAGGFGAERRARTRRAGQRRAPVAGRMPVGAVIARRGRAIPSPAPPQPWPVLSSRPPARSRAPAGRSTSMVGEGQPPGGGSTRRSCGAGPGPLCPGYTLEPPRRDGARGRTHAQGAACPGAPPAHRRKGRGPHRAGPPPVSMRDRAARMAAT